MSDFITLLWYLDALSVCTVRFHLTGTHNVTVLLVTLCEKTTNIHQWALLWCRIKQRT